MSLTELEIPMKQFKADDNQSIMNENFAYFIEC